MESIGGMDMTRALKILKLCIGTVTLLGIGLAIAIRFGRFEPHTPGEIAGWVSVVLVGVWVSTTVHELSHTGVGRRLGLAIHHVKVGPLLLDFTSGRPRLRTCWRLTDIAYGRVTFAIDTLPPNELRSAVMRMAAAGPIGESLFCVTLFAAAAVLPQGPGWIYAGMTAVGCWALFSSFANLIPCRIRGQQTDGATLWRLWRNTVNKAATAELTRWGNHVRGAAPPGDWPAELIREMESALAADRARPGTTIGLSIYAGYLLYLHHADLQEWEEANRFISNAVDLIERVLPGHRRYFEIVMTIYAVHLALWGGNARGARSALDRIASKSEVRRNSLFIGAQAAIALAEEDPRIAVTLAKSAKELLAPTLGTIGADRMENGWWDVVIARAEALGPASTTPLRPIDGGTSVRPVIGAAIARGDLFAWDPGVPSDLRTVWIWRGRYLAELELSA